MIRSILILAFTAGCLAQYTPNRANTAMTQDGIPAWYQMSKQAAAPSYPSYDRRDQFDRIDRQPAASSHSNSYAGYPPAYNAIRSGSSYPENHLAGQMPSQLSTGPVSSQANRRYPAVNGQQDMNASPYESSISRYHKLLLLKKMKQTSPSTTTTTTTTNKPVTLETTKLRPRGPQSLRNIYSTIKPRVTIPPTAPEQEQKNRLINTGSNINTGIHLSTPRLKWKKLLVKGEASTLPAVVSPTPLSSTSTSISTPSSTSASTSTSAPTSTTTSSFTTSHKPNLPETLTTHVHSRFICRHKPSEETTRQWKTIAPFRAIDRSVEPGFRIVAPSTGRPENRKEEGEDNRKKTKTSPEEQAVQLIEYLLPNSEFLAAIKDMVAKLKASLDETGIDQDVRLMSNQLRNTWQQIRTGPVNEQLGRLFEKAVADATDARTIRD